MSALASIIESRDPYTSVHQKRVATLATGIAEELGLDRDKIEAIRIAALIHDIGKINIPNKYILKGDRYITKLCVSTLISLSFLCSWLCTWHGKL